MKITLISLSTPTFNNIRAASALPYHLIMGVKENSDIDIEIYSYNINNIDNYQIKNIERELNVNIHLLSMPWWITWMFRLHLGILRIFLSFPYLCYLQLPKRIVKNIRNSQSDLVWIYGEELAGLTKHFLETKQLVTMPDCESMYYYRLLKKKFGMSSLLKTFRYTYAYYQYRNMEQTKCFIDNRILYHFVGKNDEMFFHEVCPNAKTVFLKHPLYQKSADIKNKRQSKFHSPIRIVIPGRYDIYQKEDTDQLITKMCKKDVSNKLKSIYKITFLGKYWQKSATKLIKNGWNVDLKTWVDDYALELQAHDVALYPISIGTGTKGKVLDAIANGLLVIGTPYALENIAVENGKGCIEYKDSQQAIYILLDIPNNILYYEQMSDYERKNILKEHAREKCAKELFSIVL